jgi:hypothetical protein
MSVTLLSPDDILTPDQLADGKTGEMGFVTTTLATGVNWARANSVWAGSSGFW